jgi:hypothetical protein
MPNRNHAQRQQRCLACNVFHHILPVNKFIFIGVILPKNGRAKIIRGKAWS